MVTVGHSNNSHNFASGCKDETPSKTMDATYRGPVRDGLAYTGARRRYTEE